MTRDEATQELAEWRKQMKDHGVPPYSTKYKALGMAIEALKAEPKTKCVARIDVDTEEVVKRIKEEYDITDGWIPCSKRLQKEYAQYLVCFEGGECYVYWLEDSDWARGMVEKEGIIAWMPLPKPYKVESEE